LAKQNKEKNKKQRHGYSSHKPTGFQGTRPPDANRTRDSGRLSNAGSQTRCELPCHVALDLGQQEGRVPNAQTVTDAN
jgi:hypothetical protein